MTVVAKSCEIANDQLPFCAHLYLSSLLLGAFFVLIFVVFRLLGVVLAYKLYNLIRANGA